MKHEEFDDYNKIVGCNISNFRKRLNLTQQQVADFLKIDRVLISYYENGERTAPIDILNKMANLFCIDISLLLEEDKEISEVNSAFAFRADSITLNDLNEISVFNKIIKNYIVINNLINKSNQGNG
jgi:transcriptional regulator with XRE-family HTH domain